MARCTPTTKSCTQIESLLHCNYCYHVSTVCDDIHTHRLTGSILHQDIEDWKEKLKSIGAKYIKFQLRESRSAYYNCYFALPITHEEILAKSAHEAEIRKKEEQVASTKRDVKLLANALGCRSTDENLNWLSIRLCNGSIDKTKMLNAYVTEPHAPNGKDEMRVYDIIRKSQLAERFNGPGSLTFCIANADHYKMRRLADQMNAKITNEEKRHARHDACLRYGLVGLARSFT